MKKTALEIFGWYGAVAIIAAYALVSTGILAGDSFWFQILNLTGSMGILAVSLAKRVFQSVILNIVWSAIAVFALIRIIFTMT